MATCHAAWADSPQGLLLCRNGCAKQGSFNSLSVVEVNTGPRSAWTWADAAVGPDKAETNASYLAQPPCHISAGADQDASHSHAGSRDVDANGHDLFGPDVENFRPSELAAAPDYGAIRLDTLSELCGDERGVVAEVMESFCCQVCCRTK